VTAVGLVCFDLGGVLIRLCTGWDDACALAGVAAPACVREEAVLGEMRRIVVRSETGLIDPQEFAREMAVVTGLTSAEIMAICNAWIRGPYPGIVQLLETLERLAVATACLSNTNSHHWKMMATPGEANYLPLEKLTYRFASQLVGMVKPDAAIYRHVERVTGVAAGEILFFDDSQENVDGAARCGWNAVKIDRDDNPVGQMTEQLRRYGVL
jgi:HAD superfamily hydrolase (TIGR01509 family)